MNHFAFFLVMFCAGAHAEPVKELSDFTSQETLNVSEAVADTPSETADAAGKWQMKQFFVDVSAKVGFSVPGVSLELIPDIQLGFSRKKN